ncbi:hypothetical protein RhiJN_13222 [Ceratobasidium sp. AG-Ba]|nr:hypothetical protein RhiJN_13222 [Ceratobasidium sp. AG-Ba]
MLQGITGRLFLHSARVNLIRYLRKPLHGRRVYRLEITAPPPPDFIAACQKLGIRLDPGWTPSYVRATVNDQELVFKYEEVREEDVIKALEADTS